MLMWSLIIPLCQLFVAVGLSIYKALYSECSKAFSVCVAEYMLEYTLGLLFWWIYVFIIILLLGIFLLFIMTLYNNMVRYINNNVIVPDVPKNIPDDINDSMSDITQNDIDEFNKIMRDNKIDFEIK